MANETQIHTIIESSQSIDFGAMVAGVATAQVTVEGAASGDTVLVSKVENAVLGDLIAVSGYCDTADTVDVVITSNDATDVDDFGAVTLSILVFK